MLGRVHRTDSPERGFFVADHPSRIPPGEPCERGERTKTPAPTSYYLISSSPLSPRKRMNYDLTRELYPNINDKYKLGAGLARPIVDTAADFMGAPYFEHPDPEAAQALEADMQRWTGKALRVNRNAIRDGDQVLRITRVQSRFDPRRREGSTFISFLLSGAHRYPTPSREHGRNSWSGTRSRSRMGTGEPPPSTHH